MPSTTDLNESITFGAGVWSDENVKHDLGWKCVYHFPRVIAKKCPQHNDIVVQKLNIPVRARGDKGG